MSRRDDGQARIERVRAGRDVNIVVVGAFAGVACLSVAVFVGYFTLVGGANVGLLMIVALVVIVMIVAKPFNAAMGATVGLGALWKMSVVAGFAAVGTGLGLTMGSFLSHLSGRYKEKIEEGRSRPDTQAREASAEPGRGLSGPKQEEPKPRPGPKQEEPKLSPEPKSKPKSCDSGMAFIAGGEFEGHSVGDFCMDITEVTVAAYARCVDDGKCTLPDTKADAGPYSKYCNYGYDDRSRHPINCVDWHQAVAYCKYQGKRLPTEWEWEWAARGREEARTYPWGEEAPSCTRAVMDSGGDGCGRDRTWAVGSKSPAGDSRDGLKDMSGNVWEWTSSSQNEVRVLRGGGWNYYFSGILSASGRFTNSPSGRDFFFGFRCARSAR